MTPEPPAETPTKKGRRISISAMQRETAAAVELIALCQTVTEDGALDEREVAALREWLDDHLDADLPAHAFLSETVQRILADGRVTADELDDLYRAIEKAMPVDVRDVVKSKRQRREAAEREEDRAEREAAAQARRDARERNAPVGHWDFMVAGVRYEGRSEIVEERASPGDDVVLEREPDNEHSSHAVAVLLEDGSQIGYVPEEYAVEVAPLLDSGHNVVARIKKILGGGRSLIPVVVALAYRPDANLDSAPETRTAAESGDIKPASLPDDAYAPRKAAQVLLDGDAVGISSENMKREGMLAVGATHYQEALMRFGGADLEHKGLATGWVHLRPERDHPLDPNAIRLVSPADGATLGYMPTNTAQAYSEVGVRLLRMRRPGICRAIVFRIQGATPLRLLFYPARPHVCLETLEAMEHRRY